MRKRQNYRWKELSLGVCYYPEHWDPKLWSDDLQRMREAGIRTVRVGEFAWSKFEPAEGEFTFAFFDAFMETAEAAGMKVILGTPTAAPPAWLTEKYPETLNCRIDGVRYRHGMRRHYTYNSPVYRRMCARIVEKLGEHYGKHPCVIGWQIDNELNCETAEFYSESDTLAFRDFLREKYGTLDALNEAWGTVFWNQEYTEWEQIFVPRTTVQNSGNPHQRLDYLRFVSDSAVRFCRMQSEILRGYVKPGDFITTNGMFGNLDNHRLTDEALDVYTYDSYPNFAFAFGKEPRRDGIGDDRKWSDYLAEVRSVCPHFGIMEQQTGANGWTDWQPSPSPKPGQIMLWAMQSIAHGADFVSFFRWRTCPVGTEINWHGILDWDNRDNGRLEEIKRIAERAANMREIAGAEYRAAFAVIRDYDNEWDAQTDRWHGELARRSGEELFRASQYLHTPMDYLYLLDSTEVEELLRFPVLIYPHPVILSAKRAELLRAYVEQGGCLVVGARTGQKDVTGRCVSEPMPGELGELTGTAVRDGSFLGPADEPAEMDLEGDRIDAGVYHECLEITAEDAAALERYDSGRFIGGPALVRRKVGKGKVFHFGGTFTAEMADGLFAYLGIRKPFSDLICLPKNCEAAVREKNGIRWIFVLNYLDRDCYIILKKPLLDVDTGETAEGKVVLLPYETKVYRDSV